MQKPQFSFLSLLAGTTFLMISSVAVAHTQGDTAGGFASGLMHPLAGLDHILAMVAVGLWGAWLGAPAVWLLPVVFPMVMALGGVLGILGVPLPFIEPVIALSAVVLGICVCLALKPTPMVAAGIVGVFAIFHGYAHGLELPASQSPVAYCVGFVLATGIIHLTGIGIGLVRRIHGGDWFIRAIGVGISIAGGFFLFGVF